MRFLTGYARNWVFAAEVSPEEVPFVVPVEAWNNRVGASYVEDLAGRMGGEFERDPKGAGLMKSFDVLDGPSMVPSNVHPLIREFYEHTTRFSLSVIPTWHPIALPVFWVFRRLFAEHVGQTVLPFDAREARRGIESHIDTIDVDHDRVKDIRGWVRVYRGTDVPIYVGIYTTIRLRDRGYVSVGFPYPSSNLTATLNPTNVGVSDFMLSTRKSRAPFAGEYLSFFDHDRGRLNVLRLRSFHEDIHVFVRQQELRANHMFYFLGMTFLTLRYTIDRKPEGDATSLPVAGALRRAPSLQADDKNKKTD